VFGHDEPEVGALYLGRYRVESSAWIAPGTLRLACSRAGAPPALVHVVEPSGQAPAERGLRLLVRLRALAHAGLAPWIDGGRDAAGRVFMVAEEPAGPSLAAAAPRDAAIVASLLAPIAAGLVVAHGHGLMDGALTVDRIVLGSRPRLRGVGLHGLLDTLRGARSLPPTLCAPEQVDEPAAAGPPADVWALGALLFELLVGRPPFEGPRSAVLLRLLTEVAPPLRAERSELPDSLAVLVDGALRPDPRARPTMSALVEVLEALAHEGAAPRGQVARAR
jgi:hypothetical protein